jgi:hypothetical protein
MGLSIGSRSIISRQLAAVLAPLFFTAFLATARAAETDLPFSIKVTEQKLAHPPDYMGPGNKIDMDFPFGPVKIDGDFWIIYKNGYNGPVLRYKGATMENAVRQPDGAATFPIRGGYILGGMWYDGETRTLYAPLHCEVATYLGNVRREIHLASSADKGLTWNYLGPIITNPPGIDLKTPPTAESGLLWDGGNGDHVIYVDQRGGYIYLFSNHDIWPKFGSPATPIMDNRVARCASADKMAPGKWQRFYNGGWTEPGIGGKSSRVNGYVVAYDTYIKKYLSFFGASSLSACDDLGKQDWTAYHQIGPYWSSSGLWAVWPTDESKSDTTTLGQNFYVYNFWQSAPARLFQCSVGEGTVPAANGLSSSLRTANTYGAEPAPDYGYYPLFESDDPVLARHTRRVDIDNQENTYVGTWADATGDRYYEGRAKASSTKGDSISFTFTGSDIYWHGVRAPDLGQANIYIDNVLQRTVDCWANESDPLGMTYMKRGMNDGKHTIKIVVKGEKNALSRGTAIKHLFFEYGADSYRASDGFSSVAGRNGWTNQARNNGAYTDMTYSDPLWHGRDGAQIGFTQMTPTASDAARKWIAPHAGRVHLEGAPTLDGTNPGGVDVSVLQETDQASQKETHKVTLNLGGIQMTGEAGSSSGGSMTIGFWSAHLEKSGTPAPCDTSIHVKAGDVLYFVVHNVTPIAPPAAGISVLGDKDGVQFNTREGKPLKIGTQEFAHGLYFKTAAKISVHLAQPALNFNATLDNDANANARFIDRPKIIVNRRSVFDVNPVEAPPQGWGFGQDLNGATDFTIEAGPNTDWGDPQIIMPDGSRLWLSDLPLQQPHSAPARVIWDPVITYEK